MKIILTDEYESLTENEKVIGIVEDIIVLDIFRKHVKLISLGIPGESENDKDIEIKICIEDEDHARVMNWLKRSDKLCLQIEKE